MLFKLNLVAALAAVAAGQAISASQTVQNINGITTMSKDLQSTANSVTLLNSFQTGPQVITGFRDILNQATQDYQQMQGGGSSKLKRYEGSTSSRAMQAKRQGTTYTHDEQLAVCNALVGFVQVHQDLLSIVIGKHGILEMTGVAYPMAVVLRSVEGVVDEIAFTLIGEVPDCAAQAQAGKQNLDNSLQQSIDTYSQGLP